MTSAPFQHEEKAPALGRAAWAWWSFIAFYYVAACLSHLRFSLWLVRPRTTPMGSFAFADLTPAVLAIAALVLAIVVARQLRDSPRPAWAGAYWLLWLAGVATFDRFLTFSLVEYAHYPQYGGLAWLLARVLDPGGRRWCVGRVLFWTTLMGVGDEVLQYLWITTTYSDYLDFNDFLVNLLAAAGGILLYYGAKPLPARDGARDRPRTEVLVATVAAAGVALALMTGLLVGRPSSAVPPGGFATGPDGARRLYLQRGPGFYGSWRNGPRHGKYYVLPPSAGLGALASAGMLFAGFGLRRRVPARAAPPEEVGA